MNILSALTLLYSRRWQMGKSQSLRISDWLIGKFRPLLVDVNGLEYSLVAPRNTSFSVDKNSGLLRVIQPLDRETLAVHEITVVVTDGAASPTPPPQGTASSSPRHTATASVTIRLLDVNDSPPQFIDPRPQVSVSELTPVGSLVMNLEAVSHDEGDNGVVRYRLLENQPEFILNSTTGKQLFQVLSCEYHLGA